MKTLRKIHHKFKKWLSDNNLGLADKTLLAYLHVIDKFFDYLAANRVTQLNEVDLELLNHYITLRPNKKPYAEASIYQRSAALDLFFTWAYENHLIRVNPVISFKKSKIRLRSLEERIEQKSLDKPALMTQEEQAKLLALLATQAGFVGIRDRAIIAILLASALYVEELAALEITDFHLDEGYLGIKGAEKGGYLRRIEFDIDSCKIACQAWLKMREKTLDGKEQYPLLFFTRKCKPLTQGILYKQISQYLKKLGIQKEQMGADLLRQTAICNFLKAGHALEIIQEKTGIKHSLSIGRYK